MEEEKYIEILIVEDSQTQALQLQYILENQGYRISVARDGREGLDYLKKQQPSIVISDIQMPEMDGWELCSRIKSDDDLKDIPVILLTSLSDPKDIVKGLKSGANSFLIKPPKEELLFSRIKYVLANYELRKNKGAEFGIEFYFAEERHYITPERVQIIDLLLSTYEDAIDRNLDLERANIELKKANETILSQAHELKELLLRDELTGLYNRRGFFTLNEQQLKVTKRNEDSVWLFYIDIDGLKRINDDYGHQDGDRMLIETAELLKSVFRESDIIARIGGDEFIILLINNSRDSADILTDRLEESLKKYNKQKDRPHKLSLSVGVASYDFDTAVSIEETIHKADEAMYRHKRSKNEN